MIRETTGAIGAGLSGGASLNDTLAGGGGEHALLADVTVCRTLPADRLLSEASWGVPRPACWMKTNPSTLKVKKKIK